MHNRKINKSADLYCTICAEGCVRNSPTPLILMLPHPLPFLQLLFLTSFAVAQRWTATPFIPPAVPLTVKTPYLQTWLSEGAGEGSLNSGWESFRDGTVSSTSLDRPSISTSRPTVSDHCLAWNPQGGQPTLRLDGRPTGQKSRSSKIHDCAYFSVPCVALQLK